MTIKSIGKLWPLFLAMALLMLGNGLQGTLTGWRATFEGFSPLTTGLIMTSFYAGFLAGSLLTHYIVRSVGHIRTFSALASLVSTAVLIQIIFISPPVWFLMRLITGFCFAGIYVIVESWLNGSSTNKTRGRILSFYMFISYGGLASGQWLMSVADPSGVNLFILSSILLSVALIPVLISRIETPKIEADHHLSIKQLIKLAPAGAYTILLTGIAHGAMFGMGTVFAIQAGMTVPQIALFMSSFITLGALSQWPLGWLSDLIDRRLVILLSCIIISVICYLLPQVDPKSMTFTGLFALLGALSLPIYSIAVAHTNDRLEPNQMISASGTLILLFGIGSTLGPISSGHLMSSYGLQGFFLHIGVTHLFIGVSLIYFIIGRRAVAEEDLTHYQVVPPRATSIAMEAVAQEAELSQLTDSIDPNVR